MIKTCTFCSLAKKDYFFENEYFFSRFDLFPVSPGHAEIIPKRHFSSFLELNDMEWKQLKPAIHQTIKLIGMSDFTKIYNDLIMRAFNESSTKFCIKMLSHIGINKTPDAYNIGINEGEAAGRTVPHLHIHIIPRYKGDVSDSTGGVRNIIPGMGKYYK